MEKLTIQNVIDAFAAQGGITKKNAEAVARTFFDVVVEGLNADGVVKINGFGTFKVEVRRNLIDCLTKPVN